MKALLAALVCLSLSSALGCEIAPIVSAPLDNGMRYSDCERAAEEYCELSIKATDREMDACIAEHRFKCLSSGAKLSTHRRS